MALGSQRLGNTVPSLLSGIQGISYGSTGGGGGGVIAWSVGPFIYNQYTGIQAAINDAALVATANDPVCITVEEGTYDGFNLHNDFITVKGKSRKSVIITNVPIDISADNGGIENLFTQVVITISDNSRTLLLNCEFNGNITVGSGVVGSGNVLIQGCQFVGGNMIFTSSVVKVIDTCDSDNFLPPDITVWCGVRLDIIGSRVGTCNVDLTTGNSSGGYVRCVGSMLSNMNLTIGGIDNTNTVEINGCILTGSITSVGNFKAGSRNLTITDTMMNDITIDSGTVLSMVGCHITNGGNFTNSFPGKDIAIFIEGCTFYQGTLTMNCTNSNIFIYNSFFLACTLDNGGVVNAPAALSVIGCGFQSNGLLRGNYYQCFFYAGANQVAGAGTQLWRCTIFNNLSIFFSASVVDSYVNSITRNGVYSGTLNVQRCTIGTITTFLDNDDITVTQCSCYRNAGFLVNYVGGSPGSLIVHTDNQNNITGDTLAVGAFADPNFTVQADIFHVSDV